MSGRMFWTFLAALLIAGPVADWWIVTFKLLTNGRHSRWYRLTFAFLAVSFAFLAVT